MIRYTTITFYSVNCLTYTKEFETHSITLGHIIHTKQEKQSVNAGPWMLFLSYGLFEREAINKCSDRTHVPSIRPYPILFEYDVALYAL